MVNGKPWAYLPGQCMDNYASVRYETLPPMVLQGDAIHLREPDQPG
jgi:hypothetical protein